MQKVIDAVLLYIKAAKRSQDCKVVVTYDRENKAFFQEGSSIPVLGSIDLSSRMYRTTYKLKGQENGPRTFDIAKMDITPEIIDELDLPEMSDAEIMYHIADHWATVEKVSMIEVEEGWSVRDAELGRILCSARSSTITKILIESMRGCKSEFLVHIIAYGLVYNVATSIRYLSLIGSEKGSYEHAIDRLRGKTRDTESWNANDILNDNRPEVKRLYRMYRDLEDLVTRVNNKEVK